MPKTVSAVRISRTFLFSHRYYLPPFALWLAFPASDYYGGSVAMGLAPGRQSRVPFVLYMQRDLGGPFVPLMDSLSIAFSSGGCIEQYSNSLQMLSVACFKSPIELVPVSGVFPVGRASKTFWNWALSNSAFTMSRGSCRTAPLTPSLYVLLFDHAIVPFVFRRQVRSLTLEYSSEF
jgi:hypothetical protein